MTLASVATAAGSGDIIDCFFKQMKQSLNSQGFIKLSDRPL
ncbi:hypothetical protein N0M98_09415 [Paenibacillus doosanensis]|nr:hypothetical protein [Paenibacillus doosanensis]MCS7460359.1 hypothetical protein [Paenibacillus doosanensis]